MHMDMAMLMEPTAEGGTAFTMHFRAEPRGLWRVMEPMMRPDGQGDGADAVPDQGDGRKQLSVELARCVA